MTVPVGDEAAYLRQARTLRSMGARRGFTKLAERYLASPDEQQYPSPLRWWWIAALAVTHRWRLLVPVLSAACLVALGVQHFGWMAASLATSPLLWIVSRRSLQDSLVALVTVASLIAAHHGAALWLAVALATGLAVKEVSPLTWPAVALAWWWSGHPVAPLFVACAASLAAWAASCSVLFGRKFPALLRAAFSSHATPYTKHYQRGGLHRLCVDLALLSPLFVFGVAVAPGPLVAVALVLIACHAASPVQNVRTVLAADVLLRCACVALGPYAVAAMVLVDLWILWRTIKVYDPVTANLTAVLGMSPNK